MNDKPQPNEEADTPLPREADRTTLDLWLNSWFQIHPDSDKPQPPAQEPYATRPVQSKPKTIPAPAGQARSRRFRRLQARWRAWRYGAAQEYTRADFIRIGCTAALMLAGAVLLALTAASYAAEAKAGESDRPLWQVPLLIASHALVWMLGLAAASLILIKVTIDVPWSHVALCFAILWFLASLALFL